MTLVKVPFKFGGWQRGEDGEVKFQILVAAEVSAASGPDSYVLLRLAIIQGPEHLRQVESGEAQPVILQMAVQTAELARQMSAGIQEAAARVDAPPARH